MNVSYGFKISLIAVCFSCLFWCKQTSVAVETLWTYQTPSGEIDNSPAVADINGDGRSEVIVSGKGGYIIAVDGHGNELWRNDDLGRFSAPPTVVNVQGDSTLEVLAANRNGRIFCVDARTGRLIWDWAASADGDESAIAAADINADGLVEIITFDLDGGAVCLSGDGDILWTYTVSQSDSKSLCPAVGDLDSDGLFEILLSGNQIPLICLNHDGTERWRLSQTGYGSSPVICDLQGDGRPEIVMGIQEDITALDSLGTVLWRHRMDAKVEHAISVADTDGDGHMEVYAADRSGKFVRMTHDGKCSWSTKIGFQVRRSPSIADVDGDGEVEILVAGYSRNLQVYNTEGQLKEQIPINGRGADSTPTIADLNGDGRPCVVVPIMEGGLKAIQWTESKPNAAVLWPEYRFNPARTATLLPKHEQSVPVVQLTRIDFGNYYVGANRFLVEISNPEHHELTVQLEIRKNRTEPIRRTIKSTSNRVEAELPYYVNGRKVVDISFAYQVFKNAKPISSRSHTEHIIPFANEIADINATLSKLDRLVPQLPDSRGKLERCHYLKERLSSSRSKAVQGQMASGAERVELRTELRELLLSSAALQKSTTAAVNICKSVGSTLVLSEANPWAPFGGMAEGVEQRIRPADLVVEAFCGEVESAALNLFNYSSKPLTLRITLGSLKTRKAGTQKTVPMRQVITLHEVIDVATQDQDLSADALPKLNQAQTVMVPAWNARQLWINVDTSKLAPGRWEGQINIRSLGVDPLQTSAKVDLTIWDAHVPEKHPLRLCHWGYVHSSMLKDQSEDALKDQVAHHTNVFVGTLFPRATYDENGDLVGDIDFSAHDEYVKNYAPHGIILFCGYQGALSGPSGYDSPAYEKAHIAWLRAWVKHLADLGVSYDGFALYPVDEPGLRPGLVEAYLKYAKLAREADPKILMYTDPVNSDQHRRITMAELERMAPYVDIWCPNRSGFLLEHRNDQLHLEGARMLDFIKSTGSAVWMYECEGNAKKRSPLGYYRGQAWLAWDHDLTGIGFWSYCTANDDPWYAPKGNEYLLIYQGEGVVPSKRWEAIRDGVEDYSMLALLQDKVDRAEAQDATAEAISEARTILKEEATAIARFCGRDQEATEPAIREQHSVAREIADQRWLKIQETRRRIAALLTQHFSDCSADP